MKLTTTTADRDQQAQDAEAIKKFNNVFGKFISGLGVRTDKDGYPLNWALIQPRDIRKKWDPSDVLER